jgi:hypothetical protein
MTTNRRIIETMRRRQALPPPAPAADFWAGFERAARDVPRDAVTGPPPVWVGRLVPAAALAAGLVLLAGLPLLFRPSRPGGGLPVLSLDVRTAYDSVIMMQDDRGRGTIVWVTGVGDERPNGG